MNDDLYEVLGVSKDASQSEIQKSYRKLAINFHPDKNPDDDVAAAKFKKLSEAYEILSDPEKREAYDSRGIQGVHDQGFHGFDNTDDIYSHFGDIFGGFGTRYRQQSTQPQRGRDLRFIVKVDFLQAVLGGRREINAPILKTCSDCQGRGTTGGDDVSPCSQCRGTGQVERKARQQQGGYFSIRTACPACDGTGQTRGPVCKTCNGDGRVNTSQKLSVNVPVGTSNSQVLRLAGQGEAGRNGGPSGDLLVEIEVLPHSEFSRDGSNIRSDLRVPMLTALVGGKLDVPTINGTVTLTIPAGTSSDQTLRIRGQGIPVAGKAGDHLVRVVVTVPKDLPQQAIETIRQLLPEEASAS